MLACGAVMCIMVHHGHSMLHEYAMHVKEMQCCYSHCPIHVLLKYSTNFQASLKVIKDVSDTTFARYAA